MERGEGLNEEHAKEKGRGIIAMMLGEKEKADATESWKEFKKGVEMIYFFLPAEQFVLTFYLVRDIYISYIFQHSRERASNHGMRLWLRFVATQS